MNTIVRLHFIAILAVFSPSAQIQAARFIDLGFLPDPNAQSIPSGISADGLVVSGYISPPSGQDGTQPFRWTEQGGMVGLGQLNGSAYSLGLGISADGATIVGYSVGPGGSRAFRWSAGTGMTGLAQLPTISTPVNVATDLSGDASIVVGYAWSSSDLFAVRWPTDAVITRLIPLPNGWLRATADAVSADGKVIVGRLSQGDWSQAFRWTQNGGVVGLGDLPGVPSFSPSSYATDASADGSVIVGTGNSARLPNAFRWTSGTGMVSLGALVGPEYGSEAYAVTPDGATVVGESATMAMRWTQQDGMRSITDLLTSAGVDTSGWWLRTALAVSDNGNIIVGWGVNPDGKTRSWLADLSPTVPEPSSVCYIALAVMLTLHRARGKRSQHQKHRTPSVLERGAD
jgi:probable HAF family extracellular repeat protein